MHSVFVNILLFITHLLTVLTQKNAVDLHSVDVQTLNTHHDGRGKTIRPVKNTSLYQCMTFVPLVAIRCFTYNKHKVTTMHSFNHKEHDQKKKKNLTCTKHNCTSVQPISNWTTLVTGNKQKDGRICLAPTTPKINCKLLSQFHYRYHTHMNSNKTYIQLRKFQIMKLLYHQVFQIHYPIKDVTCLIFAT
jgi:hypothetical protein